ncbi:hypothetical protein RRG08_011810 [Elysia crispata]|uniref:Uncharacterized protein n=1 Tax=Elysia crispata TaxID=231223 RepID=A0AAE1AFQ1_9GAST|nr:hypothetical protein RRG08_011810 [Elysia crispata]
MGVKGGDDGGCLESKPWLGADWLAGFLGFCERRGGRRHEPIRGGHLRALALDIRPAHFRSPAPCLVTPPCGDEVRVIMDQYEKWTITIRCEAREKNEEERGGKNEGGEVSGME